MITVLSILILLNSCTMNQQNEISLPGKIAVSKSDRSVIIYDSNKVKVQFKLRDDEEVRYSGLRWMHLNDSFIGIEYLQTKDGPIYQGNVVRFDLKGKIIERIYESEEGELAANAYPTRDDKNLLITSERISNRQNNPLEGLSRKQSVLILDLKQKKVIKEIQNIGSSPSLQIEESPWMHEGNRFIYSLTSGRKIVSEGEVINPLDEGYAGVYIYDLTSDQKKLLITDAHFAIASPISNRIAYIKEGSIRVLDLDKNVEKIVYKFGVNDKVPNIHWTPDGKHIYFSYFHYHLGLSDLFTAGERLIEVNTGSEVLFTKIRNGFHPYTWR
jgi:hypothetical protein